MCYVTVEALSHRMFCLAYVAAAVELVVDEVDGVRGVGGSRFFTFLGSAASALRGALGGACVNWTCQSSRHNA